MSSKSEYITRPDGGLLWTSKLFLEGIDFDLTYFPLKHLAYKAVVSAATDIYAAGGTPARAMLTLGVSSKMSESMLNDLTDGFKKACQRYSIIPSEASLKPSLTGLTVSVSLLGGVDSNPIAYDTAGEGDLICVSGDLGAAYLGVQILEREKRLFASDRNFRPSLEGYDYILQRQLKPEARRDIVESLRKQELVPTAMMSLTCGLAADLMGLCTSSGLGCNIYEHKLPIDPCTEKAAAELNVSPSIAALDGGEDFELLFTVKVDDYQKIVNIEDVSIIGYMIPALEGMNFQTENDESVQLEQYRIINPEEGH